MRAPVSSVLARAPLGVLLIAALLTLAGIGFVAGGAYLILNGSQVSLWAGATSLLIGPAILYFVYHLIRLARWTWLALASVLVLLFLSSVIRMIVSPGVPIAAAMEVAVEIGAAAYILRPKIRSRYGWMNRMA